MRKNRCRSRAGHGRGTMGSDDSEGAERAGDGCVVGDRPRAGPAARARSGDDRAGHRPEGRPARDARRRAFPKAGCVIEPGDLADAHFRSRLWEREAPAGGLDVLVNNAGFGRYGELADQDLGVVRRIFEVNVIALTDLTQRAARHMSRAGSGARSSRSPRCSGSSACRIRPSTWRASTRSTGWSRACGTSSAARACASGRPAPARPKANSTGPRLGAGGDGADPQRGADGEGRAGHRPRSRRPQGLPDAYFHLVGHGHRRRPAPRRVRVVHGPLGAGDLPPGDREGEGG